MKIRLLVMPLVLGLAACSSGGDNGGDSNTINGIPISGTDPDSNDGPIAPPAPESNEAPAVPPPRDDSAALPAEFTGGASLTQSEYHFHCASNDEGTPVVAAGFYDDRTGRAYNSQGDDPGTWTVSGNNVVLDVPARNGTISFDNVTFIRTLAFTANIGTADTPATCTAFQDGTELPLDTVSSSIDGLTNGATLATGTNAWGCTGDAFSAEGGTLAFFEDASGVVGAGRGGPGSIVRWNIEGSNNVRISGEGFNTLTLESVSVSGDVLSFDSATQGESTLGSASCDRFDASFSENGRATQQLHSSVLGSVQ